LALTPAPRSAAERIGQGTRARAWSLSCAEELRVRQFSLQNQSQPSKYSGYGDLHRVGSHREDRCESCRLIGTLVADDQSARPAWSTARRRAEVAVVPALDVSELRNATRASGFPSRVALLQSKILDLGSSWSSSPAAPRGNTGPMRNIHDQQCSRLCFHDIIDARTRRLHRQGRCRVPLLSCGRSGGSVRAGLFYSLHYALQRFFLERLHVRAQFGWRQFCCG